MKLFRSLAVPVWLLLALARPSLACAQSVPQNLDQLWQDFAEHDRTTPLQAEVLKEWQEQEITCQIVRYQVGVYKGEPSRVAGFLAYPAAMAGKLPGLLHLHGGGQSASLDTAVTYARRGYVCLSVNWGGNPLRIGSEVVMGPQTDWGKLDATHPPQRNPVNHFAGPLTPDAFTLDDIESPRNSNWYLVLIAARRGLSFLQQHPRVDGERLGALGHSMGGKLTTNLAGIDSRVRAAVPSCGGSGELTVDVDQMPGGVRTKRTALELACVSDNAYLPRIRCPILWLSPTNDFHGLIDHMAWNWRQIADDQLRLSISPHFNHRHADAQAITEYLFFEEHLKKSFTLPRTPQVLLGVTNSSQVPSVRVTADESLPVRRVEVFYSQDPHTITRFWHSATVPELIPLSGPAEPSPRENTPRENTRQRVVSADREWRADCPLLDVSQPLFVFANVTYDLPRRYQQGTTVAGQKIPQGFVVSSRVEWMSVEQLRGLQARATDKPTNMIDDGSHPWRDWFQLNWDHPPLWTAVTRKIKDPKYRGPDGAVLRFELQSEVENQLIVTVTRNGWGAMEPGEPAREYAGRVALGGSLEWQTVTVRLDELQVISPVSRTAPAAASNRERVRPQTLENWRAVTELSISPSGMIWHDGEVVRREGKPWKGSRLIRNLRWEMD